MRTEMALMLRTHKAQSWHVPFTSKCVSLSQMCRMHFISGCNMASSKWRAKCAGEKMEKENCDDRKKINGHCEDLGEVDKENQGDGETQVVLVLRRPWVCNCLVSNSPT